MSKASPLYKSIFLVVVLLITSVSSVFAKDYSVTIYPQGGGTIGLGTFTNMGDAESAMRAYDASSSFLTPNGNNERSDSGAVWIRYAIEPVDVILGKWKYLDSNYDPFTLLGSEAAAIDHALQTGAYDPSYCDFSNDGPINSWGEGYPSNCTFAADYHINSIAESEGKTYGFTVVRPDTTKNPSCPSDIVQSGGMSICRIRERSCPDGLGYQSGKCVNLTNAVISSTEKFFAQTTIRKNPKECPVSNPVNPSSGNKFQIETDYTGNSASTLKFERYYNSTPSEDAKIGKNWQHNYFRKLTPEYKYPYYPHDPTDTTQSSLYDTKSQACASGWAELQSQVGPIPGSSVTAELDASGNCHIKVDGVYWRTLNIISDIDPVVVPYELDPTIVAWNIEHPNGLTQRFEGNSGVLTQEAISTTSLEKTATGFIYTDENNTVETYDLDGKLISITDINGNTQTLDYVSGTLNEVTSNTGEKLTFTYDAATGNIDTVTDHANRSWVYRYDANGNLEYVDNPDVTTKQYHYEDLNHGNALTGITDENNTRFATYEYDTQGRTTSSYHAGNAIRVDISYDTDTTRTLTNSRGVNSTYTYQIQNGMPLLQSISGPGCVTCGSGNTSYTYNPENNYLLSKTENGIKTKYGNYDSNGNHRCKVEGINAADTNADECGFDPVASPDARRIDYTYDSRFHSKVATITEPSVYTGGNKVTTYTYDDFGNVINISITGYKPDGTTVSRTTTMTYNGPMNQLSQINGPRPDTDVIDTTTFEYHPYTANPVTFNPNNGRLKSVTGPTGIKLRDNIQYTTTGKIQSENRPNGLILTYTYYPNNDRLETITESDGITNKVTRWTYLNTGEVETITTAFGTIDATTLTFSYDAARRLTRITDGLGNYIQYTLDTEGNKEKEELFDSTNALKKALTQTYDNYNRLDITKHGDIPASPLEQTDSNFSPDGTLNDLTDGENTVTDYTYDDLKRLATTTQDVGGADTSTQDALTKYGYDAGDRLTSIIDPNNGTTTYEYDDLGNLLNQTSPDTGTTTYTYDEAGNVFSQTDAKLQTIIYSYDAMNRLKTVDVQGSSIDDVSYTYDNCTNGEGRICSVAINGANPVTYSYDAFGNVQNSQGTGYSYDFANRTKTVTYPSGDIVTYSYDTAGQISQIELDQGGTITNIASNISYAPFGSVTNLDYGNGKTLTQQFDTAYRMIGQDIATTAINASYSQYDGNGNLKQQNINANNNVYTYDALNRLDTANGNYGSQDFGYDKVGNRLSYLQDAVNTTYGYEPNSNRLDTIDASNVILDANGNTTAQGNQTFGYTAHNRLKTVTDGGIRLATYTYNGLGQRTRKAQHSNPLPIDGDATGDLVIDMADFNAVLNQILEINNAPGQSDCNNDSNINVQDLLCIYNKIIAGDTQNSNDVITNFVYNLQGRLIGEYTDDGMPIQETIYLGNTPVATIQNGNIYYIYADHLGTPRAIMDNTGTIVWQWLSDPFGQTVADEDPDGDLTTLTFNQRFPGQYYDEETGFHYNYFRYYDPSTGRYVTSDPIGLEGGDNLYGYVYGNPLNFLDYFGLATEKIDGNKIQVHKKDPDTWPSKPHGHIYDKNRVVDKDGNIYDKNTKKKVGQLSKKGKSRLKDFLKKAGLLGLAVTIGDILSSDGDLIPGAMADILMIEDAGDPYEDEMFEQPIEPIEPIEEEPCE